MGNRPDINPDMFIESGLLDRAADFHLRNWARWMRIFQVGKGYDNKSTVITGYGSDTFQDMLDRKEREDAKIANAAVESLAMHHQCSIHNVYLANVWRFRGDPVEVFLEAAKLFWINAARRGLT